MIYVNGMMVSSPGPPGLWPKLHVGEVITVKLMIHAWGWFYLSLLCMRRVGRLLTPWQANCLIELMKNWIIQVPDLCLLHKWEIRFRWKRSSFSAHPEGECSNFPISWSCNVCNYCAENAKISSDLYKARVFELLDGKRNSTLDKVELVLALLW